VLHFNSDVFVLLIVVFILFNITPLFRSTLFITGADKESLKPESSPYEVFDADSQKKKAATSTSKTRLLTSLMILTVFFAFIGAFLFGRSVPLMMPNKGLIMVDMPISKSAHSHIQSFAEDHSDHSQHTTTANSTATTAAPATVKMDRCNHAILHGKTQLISDFAYCYWMNALIPSAMALTVGFATILVFRSLAFRMKKQAATGSSSDEIENATGSNATINDMNGQDATESGLMALASSGKLSIYKGRPQIETLLQTAANSVGGQEVAVIGAGPEAMLASVKTVCFKNGNLIYMEKTCSV
jgi:hypothetical protein